MLNKADLARLAAKWQKVKQEASSKAAPPVTVKSVRPKLRCSVTAIPGGRLVTIEDSDSESEDDILH